MKNLIFLIIAMATFVIAQPNTAKGETFANTIETVNGLEADKVEDSYTKSFDIDRTSEVVYLVKKALGNPISSVDGILTWSISSSNFNYTVELEAGKIDISFEATKGHERSAYIKTVRTLMKSVSKHLK